MGYVERWWDYGQENGVPFFKRVAIAQVNDNTQEAIVIPHGYNSRLSFLPEAKTFPSYEDAAQWVEKELRALQERMKG